MPLTAIKLTIETYLEFMKSEFPISFDNYEIERFNWSIKSGMESFVLNFFLWLALAVAFDLIANRFSWLRAHCKSRTVLFENSDLGVMEIQGLKERTATESAGYHFKVQKSQIFCLIGNEHAHKRNLMEMLAGRKASQGSIVLKDCDFFVRGEKPNLAEFMAYRPSEITLDGELTAMAHLNLFANLRGC